MSFVENIESTDVNDNLTVLMRHGNNRVCFVCSEAVTQAAVYHDGLVNGHILDFSSPDEQDVINQDQQELFLMIVMHPHCATILGQCLIADGYLNRNKK
ncbi:hypothetical protein PT286_02420 [Neisseriaceae bacterium ESL0693]|nr:hypothetical protein [Neisseriaceae bacterium ESL0693]